MINQIQIPHDKPSVLPRRPIESSHIFFLALILSLTFSVSVFAQSFKWSVVLVDSPIHIGDDYLKAFAHPNPHAKSYQKKFKLPDHIKRTLVETFVINLDVSDLTSKKNKRDAKALREGLYVTKLTINGQEVAILNNLVRIKELPQKKQHLTIEFRGTVLKNGENVIEIIPGVGGNNLEDFEIFGLTIEQK